MNNMNLFPHISMVEIDLYCDGNLPRGISIAYLMNGTKTFTSNYLRKISESENLKKSVIVLKHDECVT